MAYDEDVANRLRETLAGEGVTYTEKRMFGGLAFLVGGHMSVTASGQGGLLVRIDPADSAAALKRPHAALMEMRGRALDGWIHVSPEGLRADDDLRRWVRESLAFVGTLPPKGR